MFIRIGSLDFAEGECILQGLSSAAKLTSRQELKHVTQVWRFAGELIPPSGLDQGGAFDWLQVRMAEVEGGVNTFAGTTNFGLVDDRGTPTQNYLSAGGNPQVNKLGPARVTSPVTYGFKDQAEGLTGRTFSFVIEQDVTYMGVTGASIQSWTERITWDGDTGPQFVAVELDNGPADIQQVREQGVQTITQAGNAVGIGGYPPFPPVQYDQLPNASKPSRSRGDPTYEGGVPRLYPISWRIVKLSDQDLFGG